MTRVISSNFVSLSNTYFTIYSIICSELDRLQYQLQSMFWIFFMIIFIIKLCVANGTDSVIQSVPGVLLNYDVTKGYDVTSH